MALQGFDAQQFLDEDWQRRPRVLRGALQGFECPVDGDDLAGLACEDEVDSRLISQHGSDWQLQHGPLKESYFAELPASHWTLLVQSVDQWIPGVAELLNDFRFLPRWRIDDIMVSYAADGGSVGPHYDQYDVFLIQGSGRRRWQLGQHCDDSSELLGHPELRLLKHFDCQQEVILEAGDILYIPPGVAHWGTAVGDDCITLSVGFRAPSNAELLNSWSIERETVLSDGQRFSDQALNASAPSGWIPEDVLPQLRERLSAGLDDDRALSRWFGQMMTHVDQQQRFDNPALSFEEYAHREQQVPACLRLGARLAFDAHYLFADGIAYPYPSDLRPAVAEFCEQEGGDDVMGLVVELRYQLYQTGTVYFDDDVED
ncbi:MAG: cupin [Spongiibacter sp.]|uniref:cupin domain-containing protein n=1 Tax=Spongiibacter TaxID=630749 RepID=UPI000419C9EE|nr:MULTISPECIES: cupin domain-containing protein [Spongiibacter]MAK42669.1 cupin [Spongiibacter sp.]